MATTETETTRSSSFQARELCEDILTEGMDEVLLEAAEAEDQDETDNEPKPIYHQNWLKTLLLLVLFNVVLSGYLQYTAPIQKGTVSTASNIAQELTLESHAIALAKILDSTTQSEQQRVNLLRKLPFPGIEVTGEELFPSKIVD